MSDPFPELIDTRSLRIAIDDGFNWIVAHYGEPLEIAFLPILRMLIATEDFLQWLPWYVVLIALSALTYLASRSWKTAAGTAVMLFVIGVIGIWEPAMATVALMLISTLLAVVPLRSGKP